MTSSPTDPGAERQRVRFVCLILAFITVLAWLPVWWHDFTYFDDYDYVMNNKAVQSGVTWGGIKWAFTTFHASNWHPLTWLSHMLDCGLFGLNPGPQHLINVLFHAINAVLLLLLWFRLTGELWLGAFVAAFFAWHPLRVESVAWIAERKDVLSMFFGLSALLAYRSYATHRTNRTFALCLGLFALGLLCKPMLVTLPFVMLLLDYWPLKRVSSFEFRVSDSETRNPKPETPNLRQLVFEKWPFFLLSVASCVLTFLAQREQAVHSLESCPPGLRLGNALISYVRYLWLAIWPSKLAIVYPLPQQLPAWQVIGAAVILAAVSVLAWKWRRRRPWLLMGWLWYLVTLVPVIGFVQVGPQALADRYTYAPLIGLSVAAVLGIKELATKFRLPNVLLAFGAALVLGGMLRATVLELQYWQNPELLFNRAIAVTKNNMFAHQVLGLYFYETNQRDKALAEFREALRIGDSQFRTVTEKSYGIYAHLVLAGDFEKEGSLQEAVAQYRIVLATLPNSAEVHNDLANLLADLGQTEEALAHYHDAVRLKPAAPEAHINLGTLLADSGRFDDALREYAEAARLRPDDGRPHYLTGKAFLRRGQSAQAIACFRDALRLNENDARALTFLARVLAADEDASVRNGTEAVVLAKRANELTENQQPFVLETLAMGYAECGRFTEARETIQKAIDLAVAARQTNAVSSMVERRQLFQAGRPSRESFTNAPSGTTDP